MIYDLEKENKEILARYKDLISNTYRTLDEEQNKLIRKAFDIALDAHKDQRRKTGEPYIYHPIEVAKILMKEEDRVLGDQGAKNYAKSNGFEDSSTRV